MYLKTPNIPLFDTNLWADYFELVCLVDRDHLVTPAEISDRKQPIQDNVDETEEADAIRTIDEGSKEEVFVKDVLGIVERRQQTYGAAYPFVRNENGISLRDLQSWRCRMYIYLLMCSSLRHFTKQRQSILTGDFESFGVEAMTKILSEQFIVKPFGKNSNHAAAYKGTAFEKIEALCGDLCETLVAQRSGYANTSTGDDGLDIVAYLKMPDALGSSIIFFANCKCADNWRDSVSSTAFASWKHRILMRNPNSSVVIIPYCNRGPSGNWHKQEKVTNYFLIDRFRLLHYLETEEQLLTGLPSNEHVDWFIAQTEDIV